MHSFFFQTHGDPLDLRVIRWKNVALAETEGLLPVC
jgi:hypothetical protein